MKSLKTCQITRRALDSLRAGSLWIFSNEIKTPIKSFDVGEWVCFEFQSQKIGLGYINPHSLIAGRICSYNLNQTIEMVYAEKFANAFKKRIHKRQSQRMLFSEADDVPGLIVDQYINDMGTVVVAQPTTAGQEWTRKVWIEELKKQLSPDALVIRGDSSIRKLEGINEYNEVVMGEESKLKQSFAQEENIKIACNFVEGQKTGFFLDQKENRHWLRSQNLSQKRILDLCCYSGGWGLSALKAGAAHVTFVDQSKEALDLVSQGITLNDFDKSKAELIHQDVFDYLEAGRSRFDVIICDPPAFVKSKKNLEQAKKAYGKLNKLAIGLLNPDGVLVSCSCSFHLTSEIFETILVDAFKNSGVLGQVIFNGNQSGDHPWILNRPETRYLKCVGVKHVGFQGK